MRLDATDRRVLAALQDSFPVCRRPYAEVARRARISEKRLLHRIAGYKAQGIVRRIGPRWDARACGLDTVLVAVSVPRLKVRAAAARIGALAGVTHNYLRRHPLNVWFTLASASPAERRRRLGELRRLIRPRRMLVLPATRLFKLGVVFDLGVRGGKGGEISRGPIPAPRPAGGARPRAALGRIPNDLPLVSAPFPPGTVGAVRACLASGRMRRFGAVLDGRALGLGYHALVAWKVPGVWVGVAGRALASFEAVSHCYARRTAPSWPYALYTMVHARDRRQASRVLREMSAAAKDSGRAILETVRTLKRLPLVPSAFPADPGRGGPSGRP